VAITAATVTAGRSSSGGGAGSPWWRSAVIYQVYPRSFADGNGDGTGDLPGIRAHLDHLKNLGVDAVWLSPFFPSPWEDGGYDVADYRGVDPLYGTLDDFDALVARAHDLGLRVMVDIVPNHTSDQHRWFQEALQVSAGSPARERYLFRDGRGAHGELPPNNWVNDFGGRPAWTRVDEHDGNPGQWYLHLFTAAQPDLNWRNPEVRAEFVSVLRFWLDRGVDGMRVDVAHGLMKAEGLPDYEGDTSVPADAEFGGLSVSVGPMWDQDDLHDIWREWRSVLDSYEGDRLMVAEAWVAASDRLARYVRPDEFHQAFNFRFLECRWDAADIRTVISESLLANEAVGAPTTWVLSNHDVMRHTSRLGLARPPQDLRGLFASDAQPDEALGLRRARAATLVMLALPGSAYLWQGEELGLPEHTTLENALRRDPIFYGSGGTQPGRDGCRIPLPWRADEPAYGFGTSANTWLPQPGSYRAYALDVQESDPSSTYRLYRQAIRLRRTYRLGLGSFEALDLGPHTVAFRNGVVTVVANIGSDPVGVPAGRVIATSTPQSLEGKMLAPDGAVWLVTTGLAG
jgi:alpha-glucosidase